MFTNKAFDMLKDCSLDNFLLDLASDSPAPGGGTVSALNGAMAAALLSMVCSLSLKRPDLEGRFALFQKMVSRLDILRQDLLLLADDDANAFIEVMQAFKLPKSTDEEKSKRSAAIQTAFKLAADIPLRTAIYSVELALHGKELVDGFNTNTASDLSTAVACAKAALVGAASNVRINLSSIKDTEYVSTLQQRLTTLEADMDSFVTYVANAEK